MELFKKNIHKLSETFAKASSDEEKYSFILSLANEVNSIPEPRPTSLVRVKGCQSEMYISLTEDSSIKIFSDALLSKGLAALLLRSFEGLTLHEILRCDFSLYDQLNVLSIISPGRLNGFESLYNSIKMLIINNITN